jgi:hypothetical protein
MVAKGNKDGHRYSYSGGVRAVEESKWGSNTARERYGSQKYEHGAPRPKDASYPQFKEDQPADKNFNDVAKDWRLGFGKNGNESAEGTPGYVPGYRGKR